MVSMNPFVLSLAPIGMICLATVIYAWRKRPMPGATAFSVFMFGGFLWTVATIGLVVGTSEASVHFWERFQYFGIVLIPTAWFVFALDYTSRGHWLTRRFLAVLSIQPLLTVALLWTNERHHLFYDPTASGFDPSVSLAGMAYGPVFWFNVAYSYALLMFGTALLVHLLITAPNRYRVRIAAVLLAVSAPVTANLTYLSGWLAISIDPAPYAFAISGLLFGWALFDHELFDVPPIAPDVAHTIVFDQTDDGVLIVDAGGYVVDHNDSVTSLLQLETEPDGKQLTAVLPMVADNLAPVEDGRADEYEFALETDGQRHYFEVTSKPIHRRSGQQIGQLLTIYDITDRKLREQRLNVLHRVLRHNVRQETNKILGHTQFLAEAVAGDREREHAETVQRAANDLVDWSTKARSVEQTLDPTNTAMASIDVTRVLETTVEEVNTAYPETRFETDLSDETDVYAHISLEKALYEIVENAAKHNDDSTPVVRISGTIDADRVVLQISDNGPGIPITERAVFDRDLETPLEHGSGLGLWLIRWLVNASNGSVSVDTDDGTTVTVSLPRVTSDRTGETENVS